MPAWTPGHLDAAYLDTWIARALELADVGLYQAKAGGRNRAAVQATG